MKILLFTLLAIIGLQTAALADNKTTERIEKKDNMSSYPEVQAFIKEISTKNKLDAKAVKKAFEESYFDYSVIDLMEKPAEKRGWSYYSTSLLSKERIKNGKTYMDKYKKQLDAAKKEWAVPQEVITAIIGIESTYGTASFKRSAVTSIGTIAFEYPRRGTYFKSELEQLFVLANKEKVDPLSYKGSYAGAIGIPQFMPSNIAKYGQDGDGDGHIDIVTSHADAISSIACYINRHGWQDGKKTVANVTISKIIDDNSFSTSPCDKKAYKTVKMLKELGVVFPKNLQLQDDELAILVKLDEDEDKYTPVVFFENSCPIHKYNNSLKYTAAISLLAEELK